MSESQETGNKISPGCIVSALIIFFFVLSGVVLYALVTTQSGIFGSRISLPTTKPAPNQGDAIPADAVERPAPTPAQQAALASGKPLVWPEQGLVWTVPADWQESESDGELSATGAAGGLTASATPVPAAIATDSGLAAIYEEAINQQRMGNYTGVRVLDLDGLRGVAFQEGGRVHWQAYTQTDEQPRLLNVIVTGADTDTTLAVLYSTRKVAPPGASAP